MDSVNNELLYVFGTGNAAATEIYNTCFAIRDGEEYFMVDAGGGNRILGILNDLGVEAERIHHIFVSHEHTDHVLGVIWMVRHIASKMRSGSYEGETYIYCHEDLAPTIDTLCRLTLQGKFYNLIGSRIHLVPVKDGETKQILHYFVKFFDIQSTKARQFGFTTTLQNGKKLVFLGDEPCSPACEPLIQGADWLLHEAFCLDSEKELWKPYEKHHATVKDACEFASRMKVPNLILWHTEDSDTEGRMGRYLREGREYYHGNLLIPDDSSLIRL